MSYTDSIEWYVQTDRQTDYRNTSAHACRALKGMKFDCERLHNYKVIRYNHVYLQCMLPVSDQEIIEGGF